MHKQELVEIERKARNLEIKVWRRLKKDNPGVDFDPFEITNLDHFISYLGLNLLEYPEIHDQFSQKGRDWELAGLIDMGKREIAIATDKFSNQSQRFTIGHEIAHYVLHSDLPEMVHHRDRPISGKLSDRPYIEQQADYFSACLLIPGGLLREAFTARFHDIPFIFDENTGFWLGQDDPYSLYRPSQDLERETALSVAKQYKGVHFESLCDLFEVSPQAMAIRLEQVGLVRKYP